MKARDTKSLWIRVPLICFMLLCIACAVTCSTGYLLEMPDRQAVSRLLHDGGIEGKRFYNNRRDGISADSLIAHGGGIGNFFYTNSREAVEDSLKKGIQFIELDMVETSDGRIIAAHDWKYFKTLCGCPQVDDSPLKLEEARALKIRGEFNVLTDEDIGKLMEEHPQMVLVVDKLKNYRLLLEKIPYPDRMIVEVFSTSDYRRALEAGVKYPAYCIWSYLSLVEAQDMTFPLVTCRSSLYNWPFGEELIGRLHEHGTTILLYRYGSIDCDAPEFLEKHLGRDFSKVYTNTHAPHDTGASSH